MTNEEKARNLSEVYDFNESVIANYDARQLHRDETYAATVEMAKWKDEQIRDIISKEIDRANRYHDNHLSEIQKAASVRVVSILSEYLGEKFPHDRFHFGFVTMD